MLSYVKMDLKQKIILYEGETSIELPLKNYLRIMMVHMEKLLPEFYEDPNKQSNSINEFFRWLKIKLEIKEGESVLL